MSEMFLSVKAAKLLILAGTDRLDKALTIGQMQGATTFFGGEEEEEINREFFFHILGIFFPID